jgi:hypothetical protein
MAKANQPEMEVISAETYGKLKAINARINELNAQIKELEQEAYDLVPKHTFDECKERGCIHTYRNRWDCHHPCVRRLHDMGSLRDYYEKQKPVFKPRVEYPMLGWKKVTSRGQRWGGVWHSGWDVVKETEKTLTLDDKTQLLKSTITTIEDVIYIKCRTGATYFCADDPATLDMQVTLLDVAHKEWAEQNCRLVTPMIDGDGHSYHGTIEQRVGESKEEWMNRIFGEDSEGEKNDSI